MIKGGLRQETLKEDRVFKGGAWARWLNFLDTGRQFQKEKENMRKKRSA